MIKQKIIRANGSKEIQHELEIAITMGWLVHSLTVDSHLHIWIAVLYREAV